MGGTTLKSAFLLTLILLTGTFSWTMAANSGMSIVWIIGGAIVGMILAITIVFKKTWAPYLAPAYALAEGVFLGAMSFRFEMQYPGIVVQAVVLTLATLIIMLCLYAARVIQVTQFFRTCIVSATGAIALVYILSMLLRIFGIEMPYIHESGPIGIGFSFFVVGLAAFNLTLDFDLIEKGSRHGAPKYLEWYGAFALMVTLVWLYIEILRLLAKLRRR